MYFSQSVSTASFFNQDEYIEVGEDEDLPPDLVERLLPRTEDFEENMNANIKEYKDILRRKIEVGFVISKLT